MTNILAIDTSGAATMAGLLYPGGSVTKVSTSQRHGAQEILCLINEALADAAVSLSEIDLIVALTGPGSFTGLRIGIGAAQGLSAALEIPSISVSTLAFQAWRAAKIHGLQHFLVAQKARDNEVYFGAYEVDCDSGYSLLGNEQVNAIDELELAHLESKEGVSWAAVGDGWEEFSENREKLPVKTNVLNLPESDSVEDLCGLGKLLSSNAAADELMLPNYVKEQMDYS